MPQAKIAPSLLSSDFGQLASECNRMVKEGADWLHMDIMDGHFVPNITMGAPVIKCVRKSIGKAFMDCHMMVSNPEQWVNDFAEAGGDLYCFHIEATNDAPALIEKIRKSGMKVGVAIKPKTPASAVYDIADKVDMILVMTVEPGFGGQKFMEECMPKVEDLRRRFPDLDIEVDGGLGADTIETAAKAGSNVIVSGSHIFKAENPADLIMMMRNIVNREQARYSSERTSAS